MKKLRNKLKYVIILVIGIIIGSTVGIVATNVINANQVGYSNDKAGDNVTTIQDAIDELYLKADQMSKTPNILVGVRAIIYYNPVTNTSCTDYTSTNSQTGTKTGCMKWYAYEEDETTYTMILDHNTTAGVAYNTSNSNSSMGTWSGNVGYDLAQLTSTSGWKVIPRLITGQEVADIIGNTSWTAGSSWFYFDTNCQTSRVCTAGGNKYAWLFDYIRYCTNYGCNVADSSVYGYWTSTAYTGNSHGVWTVSYDGGILYNGNHANYSYYGLRPVITVNKSDL